MSLTEAARQLKISKGYLSNIEHGRELPNTRIVRFYEECFHADGQASGLYLAAITEPIPPQRLDWRQRPAYPLAGDAATFVADITIPDGSIMAPYQEFEKTWRIRNSGTVPWIGRWLARRGSHTGHGVPTSPLRVPIPDTQPGEHVDITVPLTAQPLKGSSQAHWKMVDSDWWPYFPNRYNLGLVLTIVVESPDGT